ncbi:malto-oligosyltrehalose trehalohydrolase [Rhodoferax sp.]|uniref:malto-oligosyltrehalose trehalohydrolase n=1 Tax=Rhodoferax sp. TaxID=50421 RepID=UPI00374D0EBE
MAAIGHYVLANGLSAFRVFAPLKHALTLVLQATGQRVPLGRDALGYWYAEIDRLPHGSLYQFEVDGRLLPDPASRYQPQGVHGPSMVTDIAAVHSPGWAGIPIEDAILYELHVGTFTPEGTLAAALHKLPHLRDLGITVIELLPLAAFPGERNWGYDGTCHFALHQSYGDYRDLKAFIEAAHQHGMAVILDVVYNHFGPEGNYAGAFAPYTKSAATPWGDAINFDGEYNYGVREFFLENTRYWLQDIGFDGFRMDAVSLIFDVMPVHILHECTALARSIGQAQGREVLMIAEHLRNNRFVTAEQGFGYHAQWNDDSNHAIFAKLTGETGRHYANFGSFDDVVKALRDGFVLDGTRFDQVYRYFLGTDAADTQGCEHVVHIQNHDQVGNRPMGDRMLASYGRAKALLGITATLASPFVPMLFMGEEYGETAPFLFFEDFGDQPLIDGVRAGRKADYAFGGVEPPDPHDRATFEASKLRWELLDTPSGQSMLAYYQQLIALKRSGQLGPRQRDQVHVAGDAATEIITLETPHTLTILNFSDQPQAFAAPPGWQPLLRSLEPDADGRLPAYAALVLQRSNQV